MVVLVVGFGVIWVVAMFSGVVNSSRRRRTAAKQTSATTPSLPPPVLAAPALHGDGSYDHPGDSLFGTPIGGVDSEAAGGDTSGAGDDEVKSGVVDGSSDDGVAMTYFNPLRIRGMASRGSGASGASGTVARPATSNLRTQRLLPHIK